jgi:Cu-Zn family superoxide dismutase
VDAFAAGATLGAGDDGRLPLLDQDGAAIVIHAGADDYATDPAGDAGDRIACGVITG